MNEEELDSIQELIERKLLIAEVMGGLTSQDKKFINLWNYAMKLQNNWNELKKIIEQDIRQCEELIEECPKGLRNTIVGTGSYEGIIGYNKYILSKMQELEQGKDE